MPPVPSRRCTAKRPPPKSSTPGLGIEGKKEGSASIISRWRLGVNRERYLRDGDDDGPDAEVGERAARGDEDERARLGRRAGRHRDGQVRALAVVQRRQVERGLG